jgi:hypothetical protein
LIMRHWRIQGLDNMKRPFVVVATSLILTAGQANARFGGVYRAPACTRVAINALPLIARNIHRSEDAKWSLDPRRFHGAKTGVG